MQRDNLNGLLVFAFDRQKVWAEEPVQEPSESILAIGRRSESERVPRTNLEHGLRKGTRADMVRLIHNRKAERIKLIHFVFTQGQGLDERDGKVTVDVASILLDTADCRSRYKHSDTAFPLFR